jgi:signal transduction histidine kinase
MVPIRSIDPIGAIGTYWARPTVPSEEYVIMLQSLADITAVTMENIQMYNELEERVKERTRELINSLNREKEMSARRQQFFSMTSHELKTPLTSILTSTSILEEYNEGQFAEQRTKHLNRINASSQQLIGIVNDFLSSEKLDQGKTEMLYELFDVKQFATCVIEQMESSLKNGQTIRYTHHGDTEIVLVKNILHNILLNLLSNASKYSCNDQPIDLNIEITHNEITIEVKDYGIGIPEADQPHIFNNYFRATNTTGIEGTGLGLHIVKRYMELLNGSIRFSSHTNEGTTFIVKCRGK